MRFAPFALLLLAVTPALAHTDGHTGAGFVSGFTHPILGPDHLVAMVAVGLWGAQLGRPLLILLPLAFPMAMACGAVLGVLGVPLPTVELWISVSALVLGLMVVMALRPPAGIAVALVGAFALFHGHAHGTELPQAATPLAYGLGFVTATGLLHLAGIAIGLLQEAGQRGPLVVRGFGGGVALLGAYFTAGALGLS